MRVEILSKTFDGQKIMVSARFTDGEYTFDKSYQVSPDMTMLQVKMAMDNDVAIFEKLKAKFQEISKGDIDLTEATAIREANLVSEGNTV